MKKQFIAKLLVLCMVVSMLPMAVFATAGTATIANNTYNTGDDTYTIALDASADTTHGKVYVVGGDTRELTTDPYTITSDVTLSVEANNGYVVSADSYYTVYSVGSDATANPVHFGNGTQKATVTISQLGRIVVHPVFVASTTPEQPGTVVPPVDDGGNWNGGYLGGVGGSGGSTSRPPKGSTTTVTNPDGSVTTTTTDVQGNKTVETKNTDGSVEYSYNGVNGVKATATTTPSGQMTANVSIPKAVASQNKALTLPIPEVPVASNSRNASTVTVNLPGSASANVVVPIGTQRPGTVAMIVRADGTEVIVPKSIVTSAGLAVALDGSATLKIVDNTKTFTDQIPAWAADSVQFTASRELFQGVGNNTFAPSLPMSRGMLVSVLHRLEGTPRGGSLSFSDVPSTSWYAEAAAWGAQNGIVSGTDAGFDGDRNITRQELAVMLYRYAQKFGGGKGTSTSISGMGSADQVAAWANEAMRWAVGSGIISGNENRDLMPNNTASRAEVASMLARFVNLITG